MGEIVIYLFLERWNRRSQSRSLAQNGVEIAEVFEVCKFDSTSADDFIDFRLCFEVCPGRLQEVSEGEREEARCGFMP